MTSRTHSTAVPVGNPESAPERTGVTGRAAQAVPGPRTDIQGLRALAVSLVLVYHLWPGRVTGGFVGVDVFFVISGFLITSHLLNRPPRHLRDVAVFWSRRIRRLLPASLSVLAVTAVASRLIAPDTRWSDTAHQIRSAALYVLNWRLAGDAVDYSAANNAATPVQHFWSLSVEEQFYLAWPLLIAVCLLVAARSHRRPLAVVRGGLLAVVVASLVYSVWLTSSDPARAYFVTPTRVWELGIGGLLAAVVLGAGGDRARRASNERAVRARAVLVWFGLAAVVVSAWRYTGSTAFPGWRALVPVLGTAAVIAAADPRTPFAPGRLLATRPVQWLGDTSYSVYLWHWPLVVLVPDVTGHRLGVVAKVAILATTLVLAALTKRYIEDPLRSARAGARLVQPFVVAALGMALVAGMATAQLGEVAHRQAADDKRLATALAEGGECFGAAALEHPDRCEVQESGPVVPSPAQAVEDRYDTDHTMLEGDDEQCWAIRKTFATRTCQFGDPDGDVDVAIVGNSHAVQWTAALQDIAARRGWRITTFFAHNCALAVTPQHFKTTQETDGCQDWIRRTTATIADGPFDLVVLSNRIQILPAGKSRAASKPAFEAGYESVLRQWQATDKTVVALIDTPYPGATLGPVPDCLAQHPDFYPACSGPRSAWVSDDPVEAAVRAVDDEQITTVDLTDHICGPTTCLGVTGGVVTYFDANHLTATYARTVAPYLEPALVAALP
jgi:peptidoglycan/LPS O-acetylase OafA/YrhL